MPTRKRRQISSFNLSFLDIMFCGFGAVVLLVLLINSSTVRSRKDQHIDLSSQVERLEIEKNVSIQSLAELSSSVAATEAIIDSIIQQQADIQDALQSEQKTASDLHNKKNNLQSQVSSLQENLKKQAAANEQTGKKIAEQQEVKNRLHRFEGEGNRQYLTGLKLGGKRVLILLDSSASMLDRTVVDIIRRKVQNNASKKASPKWQRAVRTVNWILSNLPDDSSLQLFSFNTSPTRIPTENSNSWVMANDREKTALILQGLVQIIPGGGTSLINSFEQIAKLSPAPDNIILITDGLPTQGVQKTSRNTVSGEERIRLFEKAVKKLPRRIPVNTILFPMEGDPMAAALFWKIAVDSSGSFLTPTEDWP